MKKNGPQVDPCFGILSDKEYLEHMIPHHQVAIDMSEMLIPRTQNPSLMHLCRQIIRKQHYEIWEMNMILQQKNEPILDNLPGVKESVNTKMGLYYPKMSSDGQGVCDPMFFNPEHHHHHMKKTPLTEEGYLKHMIPHHQVAINMSERLLKHTTNTYLQDFCRKLIYDQKSEIFYMNNLLQNPYNYQSCLF